jgi:hypothetical protein
MVTTEPSFNFTYGYVRIVARLPKDPNAWPAFWMLPSDHATVLPEIDIMEMLGRTSDHPFVTFHPATGIQQQRNLTTADLSSGWHTFGLDWEPGSLTWYVDGNAVLAVTANVPNQPMDLLADLALTNVVAPLELPDGLSVPSPFAQIGQSLRPGWPNIDRWLCEHPLVSLRSQPYRFWWRRRAVHPDPYRSTHYEFD